MSFLAGHARVDITPPVGTWMAGYAARKEPAQGIHDPIFANAVAVSDGEKKIVMIAMDVASIDEAETASLRRDAAAELGVRPEDVLVNTSHTHAGPMVARREYSQFDEGFFASMREKTIEAADIAAADIEPARLAVGAAALDIGCNRRERTNDGTIVLGVNREGATLHEVTVWRLSRDGTADIVLFSAPFHGTTLGPGNLLISAEWMGSAVRKIEEASPGLRAVFLQGCAGNQNPYREERTFDKVDRHGDAARDAVLDSLGSLREIEPLPLASVARNVPVPHEGGGSTGVPLHGLRLGEAVVLGLGGEAFVEYALHGRERSFARSTLVLGYTDGSVGYLPTEAAFAEGGYETVAYEYWPGGRPWSPRIEGVIRGEMVRILEELESG